MCQTQIGLMCTGHCGKILSRWLAKHIEILYHIQTDWTLQTEVLIPHTALGSTWNQLLIYPTFQAAKFSGFSYMQVYWTLRVWKCTELYSRAMVAENTIASVGHLCVFQGIFSPFSLLEQNFMRISLVPSELVHFKHRFCKMYAECRSYTYQNKGKYTTMNSNFY